jgi:glycosyltransferase involved in cell wall biosynthesis
MKNYVEKNKKCALKQVGEYDYLNKSYSSNGKLVKKAFALNSVVIVTTSTNFEIGGEANFVKESAKYFMERGFDVHLIHRTLSGRFAKHLHALNTSLNKDKPKTIRDVKTFSSAISLFLFTLFCTPLLLTTVKTHKIRLIHTQDFLFTGFPGAVVSSITGVPLLVHSHGVTLGQIYLRATKLSQTFSAIIFGFVFWISKFVLSKSAKIVTVSEPERSLFKEMGFYAEKIPPIALSEPELSLGRDEIKTQLDIPLDSFVVGYVGRLVPEKCVDILIKAFAAIRQDISPNVFLLIIGGGPCIEDLKKLAEDQNVSDRTIFLGYVATDIKHFYRAIDVLVIPSVLEGLPVVILEAWANKVPIVMSRIPVFLSIAKDRFNSLMFSVGNNGDLAEKINTLITNDDLRQNLAMNGLIEFNKKYRKEVILGALEKSYRECIERKK